jgi:hypothetical protein
MAMPYSSRNTATALKGIRRGVGKALRSAQVGNLWLLLSDEKKKKRLRKALGAHG